MTVVTVLLSPIDEGCATRYNPGVMDEVVANRVGWRQLDLTQPHGGYVGLQSCEHLNRIVFITLEDGTRIRIICGQVDGQRGPVAWYGPIVMNTQEELRIAFEEYRSGTFIKHKSG